VTGTTNTVRSKTPHVGRMPNTTLRPPRKWS